MNGLDVHPIMPCEGEAGHVMAGEQGVDRRAIERAEGGTRRHGEGSKAPALVYQPGWWIVLRAERPAVGGHGSRHVTASERDARASRPSP
jgi:hypothetical protein